MDNIDIIATIDMIFEHLTAKIDKNRENALDEAKRAVKMIALHTYCDTGDVVDSLMPKGLV